MLKFRISCVFALVFPSALARHVPTIFMNIVFGLVAEELSFYNSQFLQSEPHCLSFIRLFFWFCVWELVNSSDTLISCAILLWSLLLLFWQYTQFLLVKHNRMNAFFAAFSEYTPARRNPMLSRLKAYLIWCSHRLICNKSQQFQWI